jgi:hypothetical protein
VRSNIKEALTFGWNKLTIVTKHRSTIVIRIAADAASPESIITGQSEDTRSQWLWIAGSRFARLGMTAANDR